MSKITIRNVSVYTDVDVDVDVEDILSEIDDAVLIKYVREEFGTNSIMDGDMIGILENLANSGEMVEYIANQYHRGAFSTIDFKELFYKMGIDK